MQQLTEKDTKNEI